MANAEQSIASDYHESLIAIQSTEENEAIEKLATSNGSLKRLTDCNLK